MFGIEKIKKCLIRIACDQDRWNRIELETRNSDLIRIIGIEDWLVHDVLSVGGNTIITTLVSDRARLDRVTSVESSLEAAFFADLGESLLFPSEIVYDPPSAGLAADPVGDVGRE